jgi:glutaredoxin-like protein NrdH
MEEGRQMKLDFAKQIDGADKGEVVIFTLSTCGWCMKTKTLLKELGVKYSYIDMDLADDDQLEQAYGLIKRFTPRNAYPTVIINQENCIVGYDPDKLQELLGNSK